MYYLGVKGCNKIYASPTPPSNEEFIWFDTTGLNITEGVIEVQTNTTDENKLLLVKE